jgi:hypothetical protein
MTNQLPHVRLPGQKKTEDVLYFFVMDTDRHVGQCEGEKLAAAMTGCFGEEYHNEEIEARATRFRQNFPKACAWLEEALLELPDEEFGHRCYVQKIETPGWVNDGRGNVFREHLAPPAQDMYLERPWYAYQSLRLSFDRPLKPGEVSFLCQRARAYAEETGSFVIERFRLLHRETVITCLDVRMPDGTAIEEIAAPARQAPYEPEGV